MSACVDDEAGAPFELHVGDERVDALTPSTGSWDVYDAHELGVVELPAGRHRVAIHSRKVEGPLMKLRALRLVTR